MTTQGNLCKRCGRPVRFGAELCNDCIDKESRGWSKEQAPKPKSLPGCVIAYAVLTLLGGLALLCSVAALVALPGMPEFARVQTQLSQTYGPGMSLQMLSVIYMLMNGLTGMFYLVVGIGLFLRQNWARWGVVVVSFIGAIYSLGPLVVALLSPQIAIGSILFTTICMVLPAVLINGYIGYWFLFNGQYFIPSSQSGGIPHVHPHRL
jgi:hypothetical protein